MKHFLFILVSFSLLMPAKLLLAQTVPDRGWKTPDQAVLAVCYDDNYVYIGGSFANVGFMTKCGAKVTTDSHVPDMDLPLVDNFINTVTPDGNGGWYIGGDFLNVGGYSRNRLAHINPDKTVDATWNPGANNTVVTIAVSGADIYVGGYFTSVGGLTRNRIAKLNNTTGAADATWNANANNTVLTIAISGSDIYTGGSFSIIGGQSRQYIAKLNNTTGAADALWNPVTSATVNSIAISGSDIYYGGSFVSVGGYPRSCLCKVNTSGTVNESWNPGPNYTVRTIVVSGSNVYVGGDFSFVGGESRNYIARLNNTTGTPDASWIPNATLVVRSIIISGSNVFAGGDFLSIGGQSRKYIAKLNDTNGAADATWYPNPGASVNTLALSGSDIYFGGNFSFISGQSRNYIARLNKTDGSLDEAWNPNAGSTVRAIAISGSDIFIGGDFQTVGGNTAMRIAKLNNTTGEMDISWNPIANNKVNTIVIHGSEIYVGGYFTTIGGQSRNRIARLDYATGAADLTWNPNAGQVVTTIAVSGTSIYAGGYFTSIGGQSRNRIARLNNTDGTADPAWNPDADQIVSAISVSGNDIYAAGYFTTIGGQTRNYAAKLNNTTGTADATWNPNSNDRVLTLYISGSEIYTAGNFATIGGLTRNYVARLNNSTGEADATWNPAPSSYVSALALSSSSIYIGGYFTTIGGSYQPYLARFENTCFNPTTGGEIASAQTIYYNTSPAAFTSVTPASGYTGTLEYKWQKSITSSSTGFENISGTNSTVYSSGALTQTTWFKRIARVDCMSDWSGPGESNVIEVTVNIPTLTWDGSVNTDWNTVQNWSPEFVPTAVYDVSITNTGQTNWPMIAGNPASPSECKDLTIGSSAMLSIPAGKALTVNGTLTNNAGTFGFIIESDETGTGSLIHQSNSINSLVERYIAGNSLLNQRTYHQVAIPIESDALLSELFEGSYLYRYDVPLQMWISMGNSTTNPLDKNMGYLIYYPNTSIRYTFEGPLRNGAITLLSAEGSADNHFLVPNPYPSAIDWDALSGWTKTNLYDAIWIWNPSAKNYAAYGSEAGTNGATRYIPQGQAFFVRAEGGAATLALNNNIRIHSNQLFFKGGTSVGNMLRISATANDASDEAIIRFRNDAAELTDKYDVPKMFGDENSPQLFTLCDNNYFSINALPSFTGETVVQLCYESQFSGQVQFFALEMESIDPTVSIYLKDNLLEKTVNLRAQPYYEFNHNPGNAANRFKLVFGGTIGVEETVLQAENQLWIAGNTLYIKTPQLASQQGFLEIFDASGKHIISRKLVLGELATVDLKHYQGFVIAKLTTSQEVMTTKGILMR